MSIVRENRVILTTWLSASPSHILQWVHQERLITQAEYSRLKSQKAPDDIISELIDTLLGKGDGYCLKFLDLLRKAGVNEPYPELRKWIAEVPDQPMRPEAQSERQHTPSFPDDWKKFLKTNRSDIVQKVKNPEEILDDLNLSDEKVQNILAKGTDCGKMRQILDYTTTQKAAGVLFQALWKHERDVMEELVFT